ncbi:unnamed protein product [Prunus brigantina]
MQDTSKQIWKKLKEMFAGKSLSNKLFLKEELLNLRWRRKHFRMPIMFGKSTLNFEEVVQDVMTHHRMSQHSEENSQDAALFAGSRSSKREGKTSNGRNVKSKDNKGCFELVLSATNPRPLGYSPLKSPVCRSFNCTD